MPMSGSETYYLKLAVQRTNTTYTLNIALSDGNRKQVIRKFKVAAGKESVIFETILIPIDNFSKIEINNEYSENIHARVIEIAKVASLMPLGITEFKKFGVQSSRIGLPLCINGELIRVGRSGIYEVINSVPVNFFGVCVDGVQLGDFIVDYQYIEGGPF